MADQENILIKLHDLLLYATPVPAMFSLERDKMKMRTMPLRSPLSRRR